MKDWSWKGLKKAELIAAAAAALALAAAIIIMLCCYTVVAGVILPRKAGHDLRGLELSADQYERISAKWGEKPLWSVPVGGGYYDSDCTEISLENFDASEAENFMYFDKLQRLQVSGSESYDAILALRELMPELEVDYSLDIGGVSVPGSTAEFCPNAGTAAPELVDKLRYLPELTMLDISALGYTDAEEQEIIRACPNVRVICGVMLSCGLVTGDTEELSLPQYNAEDIRILAESSSKMQALKLIDLDGALIPTEDFALLRKAYPQADINCTLSFYGVVTPADAETLVLDGVKISDTTELDRAVELMPRLQKVYMSHCGLTNEELAALNDKYENVRIVWTVSIKGFECLTDADNFCVSRITSNYGIMVDEHVSPIRYCTDMVTLDLGHMYYESIDFVENMPKLRYFIIGDTKTYDLSPLKNCPELYYLEMFLTYVTDLSPLFELKELRHLNISYCQLEDYTQLFELTWLDRLWFVKSGLSLEQQREIREALPNTEVSFYALDDSSVDYHWRKDDSYFEMRDNLGMWYHYLKPGT